MDFLWKATTGIINRWLNVAITYQDILHGFWVGQGAVTDILKANLIYQMTAIMEAVLHTIFLDLQKED